MLVIFDPIIAFKHGAAGIIPFIGEDGKKEKNKITFRISSVIKAMMHSDIKGNSNFADNGFVVVHNHPGGCKTPSEKDHQATIQLAHSAKLLGFYMLDHWILVFKDQQNGDLDVSCWSYDSNGLGGFLNPEAMLFPHGDHIETAKNILNCAGAKEAVIADEIGDDVVVSEDGEIC